MQQHFDTSSGNWCIMEKQFFNPFLRLSPPPQLLNLTQEVILPWLEKVLPLPVSLFTLKGNMHSDIGAVCMRLYTPSDFKDTHSQQQSAG